MAENDNTGAGALGKPDTVTEIATALFECRLTLEAALVGLKALMMRIPTGTLASELDILLKFLRQASDAFEALALKLDEVFSFRSGYQA